MIITIREAEHKVECIAPRADWLFFLPCDVDECFGVVKRADRDQWRMLTLENTMDVLWTA